MYLVVSQICMNKLLNQTISYFWIVDGILFYHIHGILVNRRIDSEVPMHMKRTAENRQNEIMLDRNIQKKLLSAQN